MCACWPRVSNSALHSKVCQGRRDVINTTANQIHFNSIIGSNTAVRSFRKPALCFTFWHDHVLWVLHLPRHQPFFYHLLPCLQRAKKQSLLVLPMLKRIMPACQLLKPPVDACDSVPTITGWTGQHGYKL